MASEPCRPCLAHERLGTLSSASSQGSAQALAAPFKPIRRSGCDAGLGFEARRRPLFHHLSPRYFLNESASIVLETVQKAAPFFCSYRVEAGLGALSS